MLNSIKNAIKKFEEKGVKSIFIKSQGGGPFSAGADLDFIQSTNWDINKIISYRNLGKEVMETVSRCRIPTVAVIDGPAVGGGCELALACDYRVMTDLSFVSLPEVGLGIIPDWGGTERLPRLVGKELAKRMICLSTLGNLGLKLGGEDAYETGFADAFVLQSELPLFILDLIEQKTKNLNIYTKPERKNNYDKKEYPHNIIKRFSLDKKFTHKFRIITGFAARLALDLINHSENPDYSKTASNEQTFEKLLKSGELVSKIYIQPFIKASQNKFLAPLFEKLGLL